MFKHPALAKHIAPITGADNLLLSGGATWKKQRAVFNPGFAPQHIMSQVSTIIDVTEDYVRALDRHVAEDKVFRLEEVVRNLIEPMNTLYCK
jgi:cytochrome P450